MKTVQCENPNKSSIHMNRLGVPFFFRCPVHPIKSWMWR